MLWGLYTLGFDWEANDFFYFIADVAETRADTLQIMYGIDGERELEERTLDHLSGYEGARPVRIGNGAYNQDQHDVWGALLDSVYLHTKSRDHLPERIWPILKRQVEAALENWREPDRGIWEVRGEPKHFTSSKLMCWVAADRGARLAELREELEFAARWQTAADEIKHDISRTRVDERGVFCQHYETDALDASVLLMPLMRFLPTDDERLQRDGPGDRRRAHRRRPGAALPRRRDRRRPLRRGGHVHDLLVLAGVGAGRDRRARARAGSCARSCCRTRARWACTRRRSTPAPAATSGNFPQAFTHLALINAVMHVIRADQGLEVGICRWGASWPAAVAVDVGRAPGPPPAALAPPHTSSLAPLAPVARLRLTPPRSGAGDAAGARRVSAQRTARS